MNTPLILKLILLLLLLFCSAFFSSSETALSTVNRLRIRSLTEDGNRRAALVQKVIGDSSRMLSAILIGNNLANIGASSLATSVTIDMFGNSAVGITTGILTLLVLIFGEITPKTMATLRAERLSMAFAPVIYALMVILTPVIFIVNLLSRGVLRLFGIKNIHPRLKVTEREIRTIVDLGQKTGAIESEEKAIINNLFDFGDTEASDIMIPRIDMVFASDESDYDELLEIFRKEKFTRIPIYHETNDYVIGIVNIKDLLLCEPEQFHLESLLRKPYFTYLHKNTAELFVEMRKASLPMAIVLDDYGTTAGLITLEDLIEEIVGEIHDESDYDDDSPIRKTGPREYLIEASMSLDDVNEALGTSFYSDDYDSIGGLMIEKLDHIPKMREAVMMPDGCFLQVRSKTNHKINKILLKLPAEESSPKNPS